MSERKYLVPEGMLRAAWHAQLPADNPTFEWDEGDEMSRKFYRRIFEAALRWLSDNPRPMNISLARELDKQYPPSFNRQVLIARSAEEWQRRMFLAPEQDDPDPEKTRYREALEKLAKLGNGDSYGNSKGNEIAQEALGIDKHIPVPQQEKDFYHPDPIIETINKRMAEYSDWVHKNLKNLFDKKPLEPRLAWDKPGRKVYTYGDRIKK